MGRRIFWECQLLIKMQTPPQCKMNGNAIHYIYFHWITSSHVHFSPHRFLSLVLSYTFPEGQVSVLSPLGSRVCFFGVDPYRSKTWGYVVKQRAADCCSTYLILRKLLQKYLHFLILPLFVVHDRHLQCETAVQRAHGRVPLSVMRDSFLTKEVLFSLVFLLHVAGIPPPILPFYFFLDSICGFGYSLVAFCSLISISSELIINLFSFPPLECIRVMALESKSYQLGYLCCLCLWWLGVVMRKHLWILELWSSFVLLCFFFSTQIVPCSIME